MKCPFQMILYYSYYAQHVSIAKELPSWGITGENNEEITRHIMCCIFDPNNIDSSTANNPKTPSLDLTPALDEATKGESNNNEASSHIMTSNEIEIQDLHHPTWFGKDRGWQGLTYDGAKAFCESIPNKNGDGKLHLCPLNAYCPNGPSKTEPLYLQMDAYDGVQWSPISNGHNEWVMVGNIADLTCKTYLQINNHLPTWGIDGKEPQLKEHLLCCEDSTIDVAVIGTTVQEEGGGSSSVNHHTSNVQLDHMTSVTQGKDEISITHTFNPMWFDTEKGGWNGGSHDDASDFCQQFAGNHGKNMELCVSLKMLFDYTGLCSSLFVN